MRYRLIGLLKLSHFTSFCGMMLSQASGSVMPLYDQKDRLRSDAFYAAQAGDIIVILSNGSLLPMTYRVFNFSSGPATMPVEVLEKARSEITSYRGTGMSVMELSHRSTNFIEVLEASEAALRRLLNVPPNYRVLFISGGASLHFSMIPMNLLTAGGLAQYVITGAWSEKALAEARKMGNAEAVFSTEQNGYTGIPRPQQIAFSEAADYVHYCSNETIHGVEFDYDLYAGSIPVICDASSNVLSKPIDVAKYGMIYAGAQKNIGPSGLTVVIIRDDLLERVPAGLPTLLDYRVFANERSMPNTPNTWGIYLIGLITEWLENQGGVEGIAKINEGKSRLVYNAIDSSDGFYAGHAEREARSRMNVTFRLPTQELEAEFCTEAEAAGMSGLAGHRSVGGLRASIYNAFPIEGVRVLVDFMKDFSDRKG